MRRPNQRALTAGIVLLGAIAVAAAQEPTVGLFLNDEASYQGYTLFAPIPSRATYLIDNGGKLVHSWASDYRPGQAAYLLENGNLLRAAQWAPGPSRFSAGGQGGRIEELAWDHLVQDHDPSKDNYGVVVDHPELIDLNFSAMGAAGDDIHVSWDATSCQADDYNLLFGNLGDVADCLLQGSECAIGVSGGYDWYDVPAGNLFFLVVGVDPTGIYESSWGSGSAGSPRNVAKPSFECGVTTRDDTLTCP